MKNQSRLKLGICITLMAATLAACAMNPRQSASSSILSDSAGMTYYTFDKDLTEKGNSACHGSCANEWPPVPSAASRGSDFGSINRHDGGSQLTYKGKPLYYFAGDQEPGERNGDGLAGVWHVIKIDQVNKQRRQSGYSGYQGYGGY